MAGLLKAPQRFTHQEWTLSNNIKYQNAENERRIAQGLQKECDMLMDETAKRTEKTLRDVDYKIKQRINDVKYWKAEVNKKLDDVSNETDRLNTAFIRAHKSLEAIDEPLHLTQQCILIREGRCGIDLVHDDAQRELHKEVEVFKGSQALLQKTIEQAKEQLRLNRKATYNLKLDASGKLHAQNVDEFALSLKSTDESLPGLQGASKIDPNSVTADEWEAFSEKSIKNGDKQVNNSRQMRSLVDGILQQVVSDQQRQVEASNRALDKRIKETRSAKGKLEEHLAEVLKEISNMEDVIKDLNKSISDKEGALRLAGTRIDLRKHRQNIELCRDPADYRLIQEIEEIIKDVAKLNHQLNMSHASLKGLCRRQLDLEEEIQIKAGSLFIDEVQCMGIRQSLKIAPF